ncbi:MAG: Crp/Fnr family transcriptional regulator [Anaerolineae bacterium]|nr:Crp/Fnr family transcriptional regulator [Anaerolineae bacterium]
MISPELLRRYPFFGFLDDTQLKAVAMIAEEIAVETGELILEAGQPAEALYFLLDGSTELCTIVTDQVRPESRKEFYISDVNPGEILGISALVEPYRYTGTARARGPCRIIKIEAFPLRELCAKDLKLAYGLMRETAKAAMERLHDTRVQLAAARA